MSKKTTKDQKDPNNRTLADNRRARHDFNIGETYEVGIVLTGSEVKSLRQGTGQIRESFATVTDGELWLHGSHIQPYAHANGFGAHVPVRDRKLLAHRSQIGEIQRELSDRGTTLVPLAIVIRDGKIKVVLGLAHGRKKADIRHAIAAKDAARDMDRELSRRASGKGSW